MFQADLLKAVLDGYVLPRDGCHGLAHWARVLENGRRLAAQTGADLEVYILGRMSRELRLEDEGDWETVLAWIDDIDDDYLGRGIRWSMEQGFYRVQDF